MIDTSIHKITYYNSPIGTLTIKSTETAIVEVSFNHKQTSSDSDSAEKLSYLEEKCIQQLDEYFEGNLRAFNLPLQLNGTHFQQTVWLALQQIPYGKTVSYLDLSKKMGNTKAIRAVGTANGSNPIAIIIPCHRVIGSNGDLTGYAGELWRKKWLLDHENSFQNGVQTLF